MSLRAILNDGDGPQHHEAEAAMSQSETAAAKGYPEVEDFTMDLSALMPHRPAPNSSSVSSHTAVIDLSQDNGDIACSSQTTNLPSQTTSRSISPSAQDVPSRSSSQAPRASSRPHSAASSQTCIPQKRKAQQSGPIDISDDEAASATASTYSSQAPVPSTSKTEDPDSDLEITHYAQSSPQRQRQPEVIHNNTPVLMGQITTVALIVNDLPELCPKALLNSNVPFPPLPVILHKDDPRFARPDSESADRVHVITLQGQRFGNLESRISGALGPVIDGAPCKAHHVRFQAAVQRQKPTGPCTAILPLHILVFSTPQFFRAMSDHLSSKSVFLDHPTVPYNGPERYNNPHNPSVRLAQDEAQARLQSLQHRMRPMYAGEGSAAPTGSRTAPGQQMSEDAKREQVEAVFATMNSGADLDAVEPNRAIVKSNLYHHQKQALAFLLDREALKSMPDPNAEPDNQYIGLWRLERSEPARWTNVVTGVWQPFSALRPVLPPQCRGAILADDMGLGKTIVIISLIAQTRSEALAFETDTAKLGQADASHQGFDAVKAHPVTKQRETSFHYLHNVGQQKKKDKGPGKREVAREEADERRRSRLSRRSRATLIICPLSTVQNWESQIAEHAEKGSTNVYIYHGSSRTSSVNNLSDHDVVITTFSTLGAEYSKMARAEDEEGEGSSDVGESEEVEVVNSFGGIGLPVQQNGDVKKSKPAKSKKPKPKAADGSAYTSPLQQIEWFRVVLDEAHMIKENSTIQAKAACDLSAERRIALTGTPLQNSLNDLFSLCRFLRLEPFTDRHIWTNYIGGPAKSGDKLAVSRLQLLTRHIALRRTKDSQTTEGKSILTLPPKKDQIVYLDLDQQERAFYASHHHRYKTDFLLHAQSDTLLKNYASILQELLRLRQICCHLALVRDSQDASNTEDDIADHIKNLGISKPRATKLLNVYRDSGAVICSECGYEFSSKIKDELDSDAEPCSQKKAGKKKASKVSTLSSELLPSAGPSLAITRCGHVFCQSCFGKAHNSRFPHCEATERIACSQCKSEMTPAIDVIGFTCQELAENDAAAMAAEAASSKPHQVEHSTKIRVLMGDLLPFSQANPASANYVAGFGVEDSEYDALSAEDVDKPRKDDNVKSVVFSQWTKLLDRVADGLNEANIKFGRLDGTMSRDARNKSMENFKADPSCEVLLVSLRAGGVGLNLTMASRVYLLEPFWNPAVENQATDRIHRLGQQRAVKLTRYIMNDTIEFNMREIQKRKMDLANLSLSQTLPKAELAQRRIENLKILFG